MTLNEDFPHQFHWLMDVLQNIDVGLVILDREFNIRLWNGFMQNHSAKQSINVLDKNIFELFPELPEAWFRRKAESVFLLHNSAFTTWEQRPYLFRFDNYRPITGLADFMYQNSTIIPLKETGGNVEYICLILYDVTETAVSRMRLQEANKRLHLMSRTDGLTGLLNRKTWEEEVNEEFRRFQRYKRTSCMLMFDIDHFKEINDTHGHVVGDDVIRKTARVLMESIRGVDIAGRYGGEEFAVMLVDTGIKGAHVVAERIRRQIARSAIETDEKTVQFTISMGVAELTKDIDSTTQWIERADKGLYQAKNSGRNNVCVYCGS